MTTADSSLMVYNTLGGKKEVFSPLNPGQVLMYCCGPTVYDYLHVGNFRGPVFYNFVRNWLEHLGYKVNFVLNFTDVDDKILNRAKAEGKAPKEISEFYIQKYKEDFQSLKLRPHSQNPKVTEHMDDIVKFVEELLQSGVAYEVNGEVLYSVRGFAEYGKLSGRTPDDLLSGARVEVDPKKRDPLDFALWKPAKEGEESWPSPWGKGRPGWHIECSAMVKAVLGPQIDIHGGGSDLVFPHHENEIAQSEGVTKKTLAKYWLHNNMLNLDGQKMSKSLGNIKSLRSFLEQYDGEIYKFFILSSHYRSLSQFSESTLQLAVAGLARIYSALALAQSVALPAGNLDNENLKWKNEILKEIADALNDDFNTPKAIAEIFKAVRQVNQKLRHGMKANAQAQGLARAFLDIVTHLGSMMSLFGEAPGAYLKKLDDLLLKQLGVEASQVDALVAERAEARVKKDFARADELRKQLDTLSIEVHDLPGGSSWEVKKGSL